LLAIAQDELHAGVLDGALDEIGRGSGVHRDNDGAAQEDSPEAGDPFGGIRPPKKDAVTRYNPAPGKRMTPEMGAGGNLCIRQLFPAVAAPLDDSGIAAKAGEIGEKTQEIFSGHKRRTLSASDMARFYAWSGGGAFVAGQTACL